MKKKVLFLVLASFILSGCGISGISQDEYNKVVEERDELRATGSILMTITG